jgi:hypothetical protein
MTRNTTLAMCGACAAVAVPATAMAAGPLAAPAPLGRHTTMTAKIRSDAHATAERRTLVVARQSGKRVTPAYRDRLDGLTVRELARERTRLREQRAHARARARTASAHSASPQLEAIAACESGGNPSTNTGNGFYGKYQFTQSTWAAVGGSGNPAQASEGEQDRRAAMLLARAGSGQWPVCGR